MSRTSSRINELLDAFGDQYEIIKGYNRVTIESGSIELGYIAKLT